MWEKRKKRRDLLQRFFGERKVVKVVPESSRVGRASHRSPGSLWAPSRLYDPRPVDLEEPQSVRLGLRIDLSLFSLNTLLRENNPRRRSPPNRSLQHRGYLLADALSLARLSPLASRRHSLPHRTLNIDIYNSPSPFFISTDNSTFTQHPTTHTPTLPHLYNPTLSDTEISIETKKFYDFGCDLL